MDIRSSSSPSELAATREAQLRQDREQRAQQAEQEARERISRAQQQAQESVDEIERRSVELRAKSESALKLEQERIEQQLKAQRESSYAQIREMKVRSENEIARTRDEGDHLKKDLEQFYEKQLKDTESGSAKAVREAYLRNQRALQYDDLRTQNERKLLRARHEAEIADLEKRHEDKRSSHLNQALEAQEQLRSRVGEEQLKSQKHFGDRYQNTIREHQASLDRLNTDANRKLQELRHESTQKLAAYERRAEDPFYRMVNLDAEVRETDEAFILTAQVPEHEQAHVRATVQGNQIVISGSRRNEDQQNLGNGRARSTSSYQTFRESFPIDWPVNGAETLREAQGETLTFTFPKRAGMRDPETGQKKSLEYQSELSRSRAPRPDFPKDLVSSGATRKDKPIS
ncbi:MAG: hypothetical protein RJB38_2257 [Pseudomonadota bacterium]|jgi:HSP20 family molecular chaperone IbpA